MRRGELMVVNYLASDRGTVGAPIEDVVGRATTDELPTVSLAIPRHHRDREAFLSARFLVAEALSNHGHTPGIARAVPRLSVPRALIHVTRGDEDAL